MTILFLASHTLLAFWMAWGASIPPSAPSPTLRWELSEDGDEQALPDVELRLLDPQGALWYRERFEGASCKGVSPRGASVRMHCEFGAGSVALEASPFSAELVRLLRIENQPSERGLTQSSVQSFVSRTPNPGQP